MEVDPSFSITLEELDAFIGLIYMRGVLHWRRTDVHDLWSQYFGCAYFRETFLETGLMRYGDICALAAKGVEKQGSIRICSLTFEIYLMNSLPIQYKCIILIHMSLLMDSCCH